MRATFVLAMCCMLVAAVSVVHAEEKEWSASYISLGSGVKHRQWTENTILLPVTESGVAPLVSLGLQGTLPAPSIGHIEWQLEGQWSQAVMAYEGYVQYPDSSIAPRVQSNNWQSKGASVRLDWMWPVNPVLHFIATGIWIHQENIRDLGQYQEMFRHKNQLWGGGLRWQITDTTGLQIGYYRDQSGSIHLDAPRLGFSSQLIGSYAVGYEIQGWWRLRPSGDRWLLRWERRHIHLGGSDSASGYFFPGGREQLNGISFIWQRAL